MRSRPPGEHDHVRGPLRDRRGARERHRDLRLRERRRVVDAVADHRDDRAGALQRRDGVALRVRREVAVRLGDAGGLGERGRGRLAVAGEHRRRDAERGEARDRSRAPARSSSPSANAATKPSSSPSATTLARPPASRANASKLGRRGTGDRRDEVRAAQTPAPPADGPGDALPGHLRQVAGGRHAARVRGNDRARDRMLGTRFERRGDRERVGRRPVAKRARRGQPHAPLGQRCRSCRTRRA